MNSSFIDCFTPDLIVQLASCSLGVWHKISALCPRYRRILEQSEAGLHTTEYISVEKLVELVPIFKTIANRKFNYTISASKFCGRLNSGPNTPAIVWTAVDMDGYHYRGSFDFTDGLLDSFIVKELLNKNKLSNTKGICAPRIDKKKTTLFHSNPLDSIERLLDPLMFYSGENLSLLPLDRQ